jgi:type IV secretory pathway VirJ component
MTRALLLLALLIITADPARARGKDAAARGDFQQETISVPILGRVESYRPRSIQAARGVVLFISGDGGWKLGVLAMAKRLAGESIVVGIPMPAWQKGAEKHPSSCWYPAGELEAIAQAVEKLYKLPQYVRPVLVGYSSGATVAYGALAQAPRGSFAGAVSLGFCPDLEVRRPFCGRGEWQPAYDPTKHRSMLPPSPENLSGPEGAPGWIALQGKLDQVCDASAVGRFVEQVPGGKMILLPKVGHGFGVAKNWGDSFDAAVGSFLEPGSAWDLRRGKEPSKAPNQAPEAINRQLESLDLPLAITWPASAAAVLIFLSGDGGWMELDQEVASQLHDAGVAVVGWSTLRYFWAERTPAELRRDLARVAGSLPEEMPVFAGGYSFGAEVIAVTLSKPEERTGSLGRIPGLILLAPGRYATFEVSPLDWIFKSAAPTDHPVRRALENDTGLDVLCLESGAPADSGCPQEARPGLTRVHLRGSHHFGGDYAALARRIAAFMSGARGRPAADSSP